MPTLYMITKDGREIYGPDPTEESAALARLEAERRASDHHQTWLCWGGERYHFFINGEALCNGGWAGSFPYSAKVVIKSLRCSECQRLNEKRKRDEKRTERLASDEFCN